MIISITGTIAASIASMGIVLGIAVGTWVLLKVIEGLRMYLHDYSYYIPRDPKYEPEIEKKNERTISELITDAIHYKIKF